jgi:hypothetical protein
MMGFDGRDVLARPSQSLNGCQSRKLIAKDAIL